MWWFNPLLQPPSLAYVTQRSWRFSYHFYKLLINYSNMRKAKNLILSFLVPTLHLAAIWWPYLLNWFSITTITVCDTATDTTSIMSSNCFSHPLVSSADGRFLYRGNIVKELLLMYLPPALSFPVVFGLFLRAWVKANVLMMESSAFSGLDGKLSLVSTVEKHCQLHINLMRQLLKRLVIGGWIFKGQP